MAFNVGLDILAEGFRTVAVHGHLTDHSAHAGLLIQLHEDTCALGMYGAEDDAAHSAEEPLGVQKTTIHPLGILRIGIFRFLGEGIVLQPGEQFEIHCNALIVHLRGVDVHIVHGGNEQFVAEINELIRGLMADG